ncbi:hypothetical protein H6G33_17780 [Calothrix sp. FACHB-1219]|uniref:hypothetical protein n=1 Tax=unclassified Calothrix TaxID=2619626 RepID=UPI0016896C0C|nr:MULTISPECIES: hypothetical protein [unclassified Calothrix]MBD2202729.1 hypothetical protein [Calothrix sp. FACHB-168]MBD2218882.1 hypothetical protein [Calothrix sp. FACHB-1219]
MRNETQHLGSSVGFRRASTQPTIFLNRAVLEAIAFSLTEMKTCFKSIPLTGMENELYR